jgi:hypothetical protein
MQLKCGQCGAPFRAADLHLDRGIAVCSACGGVQRLPGPTVSEPRQAGDPSPARKPLGDVPAPAQITVEDDGHELTIRQRWFHWALLFLLFFAIAWDSFLVGWYWMLTAGPFGGNGGMPGPFKLIFFVFPIAHVAVGVGLTYFVVAGLLNSTVVRVANGMLSVRHGPIPWRGNLDLPTDGIEQIFCQNKLHKSRDDDGRVTTSIQYEVHAVVNGQKTKLVGGLHEADHALFIEQRLERFLGIEDRAIPGEMSAL